MYVTVNRTEIHCATAGSGHPCLIPSLAGTPIYERTFAPALGDHLRLIFAELRGNRTAVGDVAALTLDDLVEEMDGLRQALGLGRVAVLGHSGHSILALAYAARFPERVARVIVVGGMPAFAPDLGARTAAYWDVMASPERKRLLATNQGRLAGVALEQLTPIARLVASYAAEGPRYFSDATYDCAELWAGHDDFSEVLHRRFWGSGGQFATFDPTAGFPRIAAPVFIAHGVFDFSVPPVVWAGIRGYLANATYHAFERSGHYPQLEEEPVFGTAIATWLARE
jgi:proline iminopeptidase